MTTSYDPLAYMAKVSKAVEDSMTKDSTLDVAQLPWIPTRQPDGSYFVAGMKVLALRGTSEQELLDGVVKSCTAVNRYDPLISQVRLLRAEMIEVTQRWHLIAHVDRSSFPEKPHFTECGSGYCMKYARVLRETEAKA